MAITAIVVGMGIRITDLTEIQVPTEIQVTTGVRVTKVTATQAGAVDRSTRGKMYLTSLFFYKGVCPNSKRRISIIWYLPLVLFISIDVNIGYYLVNINQHFGDIPDN